MATSLSRVESWSLLATSVACLAILFQTFQGDGAPLVASIAFSGLAFTSTYALIRWLGDAFIRAGLKGKDMSKVRRVEIPESMGAICAVVYLLIIIVFIPFPFYKDIVAATSGGGNRDAVVEVKQVETGRFLHRFPHNKLASYLSAILSLQSIVLLGIGDDLFDIRWRHKVLIPAFASIPLLTIYFVDFGVTQVVVPTPLQKYLGELIELGWLYYAYMAAVSIFCPNSINILAGINGIEVAQSVVIALLIMLNDSFYLYPFDGLFTSSDLAATGTLRHPATDSHLFSLYFLLPFIGVSLAILLQNWYPAKVFVGDTYCYFAGMVFAVVAILGHFSKTLLLLLIPQIFNFAYSAPQLFGLVPCPRHRLPHFNVRSGLLEPSWSEFHPPNQSNASDAPSLSTANGNHKRKESRTRTPSPDTLNGTVGQAQPSLLATAIITSTSAGTPYRLAKNARPPHRLTQSVLKLLHAFHLIRVETDASSGEVIRCTNMTILNLFLVWFGPMREDRLALAILLAQTVAGLFGLWVRHMLARWVFGIDNRAFFV